MTVPRLYDALFNRLREATRVLEDHYRFIEERPQLTAEIKQLRHHILKLERNFFSKNKRERRVTSDVGRHNKAPLSSARHHCEDVVNASWSRLQESLRSLEEQSKLYSPQLSVKAEELRYQSYHFQEMAKSYKAWQWPLYALITQSLNSHPLETLIKNLIDGGVEAIQVREKSMNDRKLLAHCRKVKKLVMAQSQKPVSLILNDRADLAALAEFDGVHVGQGDITPKEIKKLFGSKLFVGLSTHSPKQASAALKQGADYIGIGPAFPTQTKPHLTFIGTDFVKKMTKVSNSIPHVVIGGIDTHNCKQVFKAGAKGVALCTGLIQAPHPAHVAKKIIAIQKKETS